MRTARLRWLALIAVLALAGTACNPFGGGGGDELGSAFAERNADDVEPPPVLDPERTGLSGVILATNSPSMREVANSPEGDGPIVIFVQPGGPADQGANRLSPGELITAIDGQEVRNHGRALAMLHQKPGEKVKIDVVRADGTERSVEIEVQDPAGANAAQFLTAQLNNNPSDPLLRFIRAQQSSVDYQTRVNDIDRALEVSPDFVEALTVKASLSWDIRGTGGINDPNYLQRVNNALAGWDLAIRKDPNNVTTLALYSLALSELGNGADAKTRADEALEVDDTYPLAFHALAVANLRLNKPEDAAGPARASVELDPFHVPNYRNLAQVFNALDRTEDCEATAEAMAPFLENQNLGSVADDIRGIC